MFWVMSGLDDATVEKQSSLISANHSAKSIENRRRRATKHKTLRRKGLLPLQGVNFMTINNENPESQSYREPHSCYKVRVAYYNDDEVVLTHIQELVLVVQIERTFGPLKSSINRHKLYRASLRVFEL
jgi:hypothetical protein